MKNGAARTVAHGSRIRNGTSRLWEHAQVDIVPDSLSDGEHLVHRLRQWDLEIHAVIVKGVIVDFRVVSTGVAAVVPTLPPFDVTSEMYGQYRHSLVYRSWNVPTLGLTVHVESWADKGSGGFVDLFFRKDDHDEAE